MLAQFKIGDKVYQLDRLTLGDGALLKRRFGVTNLEEFDPRDPETLLGLLALAIHKTDGTPIEKAEERASALGFDDFSQVEASESTDPTKAAADNAVIDVPVVNGPSVTTPPQPGIQP